MRISFKFLVLSGVTVMALVAAFCLLGNFVLTGYAEKTVKDELQASAWGMEASVEGYLQSLASAGTLIASNPEFARAVADKDMDAIKAFAKELHSLPGISLVTICDPDTVVLARGHSGNAGDTLGERRLSARIPLREGRMVTGLEPGNETKLTLACGVPLKRDGSVVGAVILGSNVAKNEFVDGLNRTSGTEYTIFLDDTRISTTITDNGSRILGTRLTNTEIYERAMKRGERVFSINTILGKDYDTVYWPWKDMAGRTAGLFFVGKPRKLFQEARQNTLLIFVGAGVAFGLVALLASAFTARAITRPLRTATKYAGAIAQGDFHQAVNATSRDEIGSLVRSMQEIPNALNRVISSARITCDNIRTGLLRDRLDASSFQGGYRDLALAVNTVADAYTAIIDALPLPIMGCTREHTIIFLNAPAQAVLGPGFLGDRCSRLGAPECGTANCLGKRTMETGVSVAGETTLTVQGKKIHVSVLTMGLRNAAGEQAGYFEVLTDITKMKTQQETMLRVAGEAARIADRVATASSELSAQIGLVAQGTGAQRAQVESTASAITEMNATVLEVARNAEQAARQSEDTRQKAVNGATLVGNVVRSINAVNAVAVTLQSNMRELGGKAENISGVLGVISDIADQTNLLALNAAIEAARAGEAGRGFAVVADEVRKLAESTMSATHEVGASINSIQQSTRSNIGEVDTAVKSVDEATQLANSSGTALEEIVSLASANSAVVTSIATAAEQQSATAEEISRAANEISLVTNETSAGMAQASEAVRELSRMAQELRTLIDSLK